MAVRLASLVFVFSTLLSTIATAEDASDEALNAAKRATKFLTDSVATHGGYLWQYSADLLLREGEGIVTTNTVWVQPPGTPTIGAAFVRMYEATGDQQFLDAAIEVGQAMRLGQLRSGGWQASIEFDADRRRKLAYRTEPKHSKARDLSSLDDDKTQASIRFVVMLDRATEFKIQWLHEMASYAVDQLIAWGQLPNGGFPQVWTSDSDRTKPMADVAASYPTTWPRTYPGHQQYWNCYTLNDELARDMINTLYIVEDVYGDGRGAAAAVRLADSLLLAQMPSPQPAWAQQYNDDMQPVWARKFEPPAISGGESQGVIAALLTVYERTGDRKYLPAIGAGLDYLESCQLPGQQLARFYELQTNRPLYFTRDYVLTHDDSDCPTHYSFVVKSRLPQLRRDYTKATQAAWRKRDAVAKPKAVSEKDLRQIIAAIDDRGAFVTQGKLKYHRHEGPIISMKTTAEQLNRLADHFVETRR